MSIKLTLEEVERHLIESPNHKLTRKNVSEWIQALRSGNYVQGHEALRIDGTFDIWEDGDEEPTQSDTKFCCLGVLCEINKTFDADEDNGTIMFADFPEPISNILIQMNDGGQHDFKDIASFIESTILPALPENA
jgi:hypothetical protein